MDRSAQGTATGTALDGRVTSTGTAVGGLGGNNNRPRLGQADHSYWHSLGQADHCSGHCLRQAGHSNGQRLEKEAHSNGHRTVGSQQPAQPWTRHHSVPTSKTVQRFAQRRYPRAAIEGYGGKHRFASVIFCSLDAKSREKGAACFRAGEVNP